MHVIVVGAGLFGSIAASFLRARGASVTVVDCRERYAASPAAGCVLKPSWLSSLSREEIATGYSVLESLYRVQHLVFRANLGVPVKADHITPNSILLEAARERVTKVGNGVVYLENGAMLKGHVLVAAGVWSQQLVDMPPIKGLYGASLQFSGATLPEPKISVYAPYKQAVALNIGRRVWMGDGTSLIESSWMQSAPDRITRTAERAKTLFGLDGKYGYEVGARPYVEGHKQGYFAKVFPRTWVSTGGAKNGTMLAALNAHLFAKELGLL